MEQVMELFATVYPPAEAKSAMKGFIDASKVNPKPYTLHPTP